MNATALPPTEYQGKVHKRAFADVTELIDALPAAPAQLPALTGQSKKQTDWAFQIRDSKLRGWKADLPEKVYGALQTITDAGWWIVHKNVDVENIGWPENWVRLRNRETQSNGQPTPRLNAGGQYQCSGCGMARDKGSAHCDNPACPDHNGSITRLGGKPEKLMECSTAWKQEDIDNFEAFARKAAMSPELSYLTMMAMLYRQTRDPRALAKFTDSRMKVQAHLDAIDKILGSPGA